MTESLDAVFNCSEVEGGVMVPVIAAGSNKGEDPGLELADVVGSVPVGVVVLVQSGRS